MLIFSSYTEPGLCSVTVSKCAIGGCVEDSPHSAWGKQPHSSLLFSLVPCANLSSLSRLVLLRIIPVSVLNPVDGREILSRFFLMATKIESLFSLAYSKNSYPVRAPILSTRDSGCLRLILQEPLALGLISEKSIPVPFFFFVGPSGESNELGSVVS